MIALRRDAAAGKFFRLDNDGNSFIKEEHLTEVGREKYASEMNGVCLDCWANLAEDDEQPSDETDEPPQRCGHLVVSRTGTYFAKVLAISTWEELRRALIN